MFLLIPGPAWDTVPPVKEFTFHYVSTYTFTVYIIGKHMFIYIPLCFYLYWKRRSGPATQLCIYIPLCFYLYGEGDGGEEE